MEDWINKVLVVHEIWLIKWLLILNMSGVKLSL